MRQQAEKNEKAAKKMVRVGWSKRYMLTEASDTMMGVLG
jgi:hypothetical protein